MANKHFYRSGQREFTRPPVDSGTILWRSDVCFLDVDDVKSAADYTWDTSLVVTRNGFANVFLGICDESSASGDTDPVNVDVSPDSVYEFDIVSGTPKLGDTFSPDGGSSVLLRQTMELNSNSEVISIARGTETYTAATLKCRMKFASVYNPSANTAAGVLG